MSKATAVMMSVVLSTLGVAYVAALVLAADTVLSGPLVTTTVVTLSVVLVAALAALITVPLTVIAVVEDYRSGKDNEDVFYA